MSSLDSKIAGHSDKHYIGRYAPSPTGRLHFGNLRTALLAWLHARLNDGLFLLRMDDLDAPRVVDGCDQQILADLEWLGLDWDGDVYYQSQHLHDYQFAFEQLQQQQRIFPCYCSRKDIQQASSAPHGKSPIYPNNCHDLSVSEIAKHEQVKEAAWRYRVDQHPCDRIEFSDGIFGKQVESLQFDCGDFVVKRADTLFAYQLAVVVDDAQQGVTDVLRGADLLDSTARQIALFQILDKEEPEYWHVPLMQDMEGKRMAKRDGSVSIEQWTKQGGSAESLVAYLAFSLGLVSSLEPINAQELLSDLDLQHLLMRLKSLPDNGV